MEKDTEIDDLSRGSKNSSTKNRKKNKLPQLEGVDDNMVMEQLMHMNDGAMSPSNRSTNPINYNQPSASFDRTTPINIMVNKISNSPHQ